MRTLTPAPKALFDLQKWFGEIISTPLCEGDTIAKITPSHQEIEKEASRFVVKSETLLPYQRVEIYNQQYWWRLLGILQENYPLLLRLFGYSAFNQVILIPYLKAYPPSDWSVNFVGNQLPAYLFKNYHEKDRTLVLNAAKLDLAYHNMFFHKVLEKLPSIESDKTLYLQPHVKLFKLPFNLFSFRREMIEKQGDYYLENPFPELVKGTYFFVLYRKDKFFAWRQLEEGEYQILKQFEKGASIDTCCSFLETAKESIQKAAENSLSLWFKNMAEDNLLSYTKK